MPGNAMVFGNLWDTCSCIIVPCSQPFRMKKCFFFFFFISHVTSYISLTYCFVIYFCHIKEPSSAYLITDKDHKSFTPVHYVARKGQAKVDLQTRCVVYDIK